MYFSVHLLLFRDQIISVASWYMLGVTCSLYFSANVGSYGSLGHSIVYCHEIVKPPNQQKPETGFESKSNIQQVSFTWYILQENCLLEPMQINFRKINSSKREEYNKFNVSFCMWNGLVPIQPRKAHHGKTYREVLCCSWWGFMMRFQSAN